MSARHASSSLNHAATRASRDPFFLGWWLSAYESIRQVDSAGLASHLRCSGDAITRLALCKAPLLDEADAFRRDVKRIAAFVGADAVRIAGLLKEVSAVHALQTTTSAASDRPLMMAARDRRESPEEGRTRKDQKSGGRSGRGKHEPS